MQDFQRLSIKLITLLYSINFSLYQNYGRIPEI